MFIVESVKAIAKRLRAEPHLNHAATTTLRHLYARIGTEPEFFIKHLPRSGVTRVALPDGNYFELHSKADDFVSNQLFWRGWLGHEPETIGVWYVLAKRARNTLDIGAHVGIYGLIAAMANPNSRVFAFEPLAPVFERLLDNCNRSHASNLACFRAAAGDTGGRAPFFHTDGIPSSSSLSHEFMSRTEGVRSTEVEVLVIDQFVADHRIGKVDLVKMDTESTEPAVLRGMSRLLDRDRPHLIIEILPGGNKLPEIMGLLAPLGYEHVRLVPRTEEQRRIALATSAVTGRAEPFDNFLFSMGDLDEIVASADRLGTGR